MGNDLIDDLALQEVKEKLASIDEKQDVIIGHLEALEAMWGTEGGNMAGLKQRCRECGALSHVAILKRVGKEWICQSKIACDKRAKGTNE